jgi:long-chain fatty acid transport protein
LLLFTVIRINLKPIFTSGLKSNSFKTAFMKKLFLVTAPLLLSSAMSFAAGYQVNLQGLRQLAMGGSGTAIPWDVSTIFYNPGGLTAFTGVQAYASAQFIMPTARYVQTPTGFYSSESQPQVFPTFNAYVGGPVVDKSRVSIGLGVYTPFGNGLKWDDNWSGRYLIQQVKLQSIFFQPTVAYQVHENVSIGAGFVYAIGNVQLRRAIPLQTMSGKDGSAELKGSGSGIGFNAGLHIHASENVQLGLSYRSRVNMKVKRGFATFNAPSSVSSLFPYTAFSTELPLPAVLSLGAGFKLSERLTLQADLNMVAWSAYDTLAFDYENNTTAVQDSRSPREYKNTLAIRAGINYMFSDKVSGMVGAAWDPSPVRDGIVTPELPDADRGVFTAGATYKPWERLTILAAIEYVSTVKRSGSFDAEGFAGKYQTKAFTWGLGASFDF